MMKKFWRQRVGTVAEQYQWHHNATELHTELHLKMVKGINFVMYV